MPSPVASPVGPNTSAPTLTSAASRSADNAVLDFAALLFAVAESPAAPGLTIAELPSATAAVPGENAPGQGAALAATLTPADLATLPALLAAVVLPTSQTIVESGNLPLEIQANGKRVAAAPASVPSWLQSHLTADSGNPAWMPAPVAAGSGGQPASLTPGLAVGLTDAAPRAAIAAATSGRPGVEPAIFSEAGGNTTLTTSLPSDPFSGSVTHSGISGQPHATGSANANVPSARVDTPLGDSRWHDDFGQKVVWLAKQEVQSAQISINPPNLGPIEISLKLGPDQATAVFTSPHADVREALEAALPRLREMFSGAGIQLGDAQVNAQSQQQAGHQPRPARDQTISDSGSALLLQPLDVNVGNLLRIHSGNGLVDTFA